MLFIAPLLSLIFVLRGVVFFNGFFFNNDIVLQLLPYFLYRAHDGALILEQILSGFPLFVSTNAIWFYPLHSLFSLGSVATVYVWLTVFNLVAAYVAMYFYARELGISKEGAILAGAVYLFSGQIMLWSASLINSSYYLLLPLSLFLFERARRVGTWKKLVLWCVLGAVLGVGWLSSHVQYVVYIHSLYAVYVIAQVYWFRSLSFKEGAIAFVIPYCVSLLVGFPMISAVLSFDTETVRALGTTVSQYAGTGLMPWDFLHYMLPLWHMSVIPISSPNLYIGILPLMLLVLALLSWRTLTSMERLWGSVFLISLLASIRYSPVAILLHFLPLWNSFREAPRIMFVGEFAAALVVGYALDRLMRNELEMRSILKYVRTALIYVLLPLAAFMTAVHVFFFNTLRSIADTYFLNHLYSKTIGLPKEHYLTIIDGYLHQAIDQFSFIDPQFLIFIVFAAMSLAFLNNCRRFSSVRLGAVSVLLVSLNMASVYAAYYATFDRSLVMSVPNTAHAIMQNNPDTHSYRVFSLLPATVMYDDGVACPLSPDDSVVLEKELMQPNSTMLFGIDTVDGYENFMPARVSDTLNYIGSESTLALNPLFLAHVPRSQKIQLILERKNVLRAMNVAYVVSGTPLSDPDLSRVFMENVGPCQNPAYVYALAHPWPRYFVTNTLRATPDQSDASTTLSLLNTFSEPTVLVATTSVPKAHGAAYVTPVMPTYDKRSMHFGTVSCTESCGLFVGNAYLRHWVATVDGKEVPLMRANYLYMTVLLPSGVHTVDFTYRP